MAPSDAPTPDEIEQQQEVGWGDRAGDEPVPEHVDRPLSPDEIEQRQEVGWDEDELYEG